MWQQKCSSFIFSTLLIQILSLFFYSESISCFHSYLLLSFISYLTSFNFFLTQCNLYISFCFSLSTSFFYFLFSFPNLICIFLLSSLSHILPLFLSTSLHSLSPSFSFLPVLNLNHFNRHLQYTQCKRKRYLRDRKKSTLPRKSFCWEK